MRMRELGFSLEEVRALLVLVDGGAQTFAKLLGRHPGASCHCHAKIAESQFIDTAPDETAAQCLGEEVPDCPVLAA